jgi:hypothetical protein
MALYTDQLPAMINALSGLRDATANAGDQSLVGAEPDLAELAAEIREEAEILDPGTDARGWIDLATTLIDKVHAHQCPGSDLYQAAQYLGAAVAVLKDLAGGR